MRQWKVGTLTFGVLLIFLGVLMIIFRATGLSVIDKVLIWWPIVLIMLGLEILAYSFFSKNEHPKMKFDGFSVFAIILIILFSFSSFALTSISNHINLKDMDFMRNFNNFKHEFTLNKSLTINPADKNTLIVNNNLGSVEIVKSASKNIEISASMKVKSDDESYSNILTESLIEIRENDPITITSKIDTIDRSKAAISRIDYLIKVPENMNIEVNNKFGDAAVSNINGNIKIINTNGSIQAKAIGGKAILKNSFGSLSAEGIKGDIEVSNNNGSIDIRDIGKNLDIESKFSSIEARDVKGNVRASGNNGKIDFNNINGSIDIENKFGEIDLNNILGTINITNNNGSINLDNKDLISGNVNIENKFGSITLKVPKIQKGYYSLYSKFGSISNNFGLNVTKDNNTERVDDVIGDNSPSFHITNENGSIKIISN